MSDFTVRRRGPVTLICGDATRLDLAQLPRFDAVVTDPPYGIGHYKGPTGGNGAYAGGRRSRRNSKRLHGDATPFDPSWVLGLSPNVALFGADHYASRLPATGSWHAWDKLAGKEPWDSFADVEFIWHSRPGKARIVSYLWKGIVSVKLGEENGRRYHPTQKPLGVMRWLLKLVGSPAVVLDPYGGSGTTAVACVELGLSCVLVEIDREFFDFAVERVERALAARSAGQTTEVRASR